METEKPAKSKISAQQKHIRKNYVRFNMDMKPDVIERFKAVCAENGTTATTELKKFIDEYLAKHESK